MGKFLPALRTGLARRTVTKDAVAAEQKAILTSYFNTLAVTGGGMLGVQTRPWPVERAVAEGYDRVMWVFKSVNTIATDSAKLPYRIREGSPDEGDPLDDHPLYRVLNEGMANPLENGQIFRKRLSSQIMLSKSGAFVEVTTSRAGTIVRLDLLPPGRTFPVAGTGADLIDHWEVVLLNGQRRQLDIDKVRWFRDPHPIDPYSGVTPLESAGLSVELDYFARLYNVSFMRNDGRPGGVLAVDPPSGTGEGGDMDPEDMDRLEARFGHGPHEAGKLSVISGKLTYTDLAARPRDMQYGETAQNAKTEILSAFGVPESVLGFAADRTYANAEQELYNYWTRTMPGHNDIVVAGFDNDTDDNLFGYLDVSGVQVLERGEREKRQEARDEVAAGLRSIFSYATLAGYSDEMESTPQTRALFVPQGRTPLPSTEADAKALGISAEDTSGTAPGAAPTTPAPGGQQDSVDGSLMPTGNGGGNESGATFEPGTGPGAPTPRTGTGRPARVSPNTPPRAPDATDSVDRSLRPALSVVGSTKARVRVERKAVEERTSEPDNAATDALEVAVADALGSLAPRWTERTAARLESPKARKGTRHWTPEYATDTRMGTKALDAAKVVDEDRWVDEAIAHITALVTDAAIEAAVKAATDLANDPNVDRDRMRGVVADTVGEVLDLVRQSTRGLAESLVADLNRRDQAGQPMSELADAARAYGDRVRSWAREIAVTVATGTITGARDAAAESVDGQGQTITRTWVSRRDQKVRPTHAAADAERQTRRLGEPFLVGNALLRYPGDPLGPPGEVRNCRCFLRHRATATGRFARKPA